MSAPFIWFVFPILFAGGMLPFRQKAVRSGAVAAGAALFLGLLAFWQPTPGATPLGSLAPSFETDLVILGQRFSLDPQTQKLVGSLYIGAGLWFLGAIAVQPGRLFNPLALGVISLLSAALMLEPFTLAVLFIELAVLLCVPILAPPETRIGKGVVRFLTFQTLGMPFILFAGWTLVGAETGPLELEVVSRSAILIGFGFAFLLAIFPFHSWVPMIARESDSFAVAFVLVMLTAFISLFGIGFFEKYAWLRTSTAVLNMMRAVAVVVVFTGGVWSLFQRHLGRLLGFAVLIEIGFLLAALSLVGNSDLGIYFALAVPRFFAYILWGGSISLLGQRAGSLDFRNLQGVGRRFPVLTAALLLGQVSAAGFPFLGVFPVRLALFEYLAAEHPIAASWLLLGSVGLIVATIRTITVFSMAQPEEDLPGENDIRPLQRGFTRIFFGVCALSLLILGIFPGVLLPWVSQMLQVFPRLTP
jgi:NADH:ubiquinone oxidoreductase subunit 2 (subunit N)